MTLPCANESRIAVIEKTIKDIEPIISENTKAINNLSLVLAGMKGGQKVGWWMFSLIAPMVGGGFISFLIIVLTK